MPDREAALIYGVHAAARLIGLRPPTLKVRMQTLAKCLASDYRSSLSEQKPYPLMVESMRRLISEV